MKPLPGDHRHKLLICGDELAELRKHAYRMAEAYGLDRKIENYMGTRPITLYRWDMECLLDVIDFAVKDDTAYPDKSAQEFLALNRLGTRLHQEYDSIYGEEKVLPVETTVTLTMGTSSRNAPTTSRNATSAKAIYQFRITLTDSKPSIWRRIQVKDCTLDKLHEHIQTSMGWTNSHLHEFKINGERHGDPELLDDECDDFPCIDSTITKIRKIVPANKKPFSFEYKYDFGDGWDHEILFEGNPTPDPKAKYPLCLEGERACPPEDCGGLRGYYEFLKAIKNPKHKEHARMLQWIGGKFDPNAFDADQATKAMKKGLPNWME